MGVAAVAPNFIGGIMDNWSVYKHTTPSGKIYIGITHKKPEYRWNSGRGYKTNTHFYKAIQKYGWDEIIHEIIATGLTEPEALKLEHDLIISLKAYDKQYGYNKALGGHIQSEASRKQIGETRKARGYTSPTKGKHLSEETRKKISEANKGNKKGRKLSAEHVEAIRLSKLGKNNPNYGKPLPEAKKKNLIDLNSKPIVMVSEKGTKVFSSAAEAERVTGICSSNINRVCNGIRLTAGGYVWKFYNGEVICDA